MNKQYIKMVFDYVNGNDIEGYDIDELENNYKFMMAVINYTNDKKMYQLCSDEVKNNYEFVKFMVTKFSKDFNFVRKIADDYLKTTKDEEQQLELSIIMSEIMSNAQTDEFNLYAMSVEAIFSCELGKGMFVRENSLTEEEKEVFQLGFMAIRDTFSNSDIILNCFAKKFVDTILGEYEISITNLLTDNFYKISDFNKININTFLINFLGKYDSHLAEYCATHIQVLDDLKGQIKRIGVNWQYHLRNREERIYNNVIECVNEYMSKYEKECTYDTMTITYYIAKELGIADKLYQYESIDTESIEELIGVLPVEKSKMGFIDLKHYQKIKQIMKDALKINGIDRYDVAEAESRKPQGGCRILNVDFRKKSGQY